ncbi:MAG: DUF1818 family protein [Xenococcus sp. (in: cyanobacteria)]
MTRLLKKGHNWRVGWDSQAKKYQGLVGSDDWAIELTSAEFQDFNRLLQQLITTMKQMKAELVEQERIACEAETPLLWLEVEGYPENYTLRLIVSGDRRCEGNWAEGVAVELAAATQRLVEENII